MRKSLVNPKAEVRVEFDLEHMSLDGIIETLVKIKESIPEAYRSSAKIDVDTWMDYDVPVSRTFVSYQRDKIPKEIEQEERQLIEEKQNRILRLEEELERLKKG